MIRRAIIAVLMLATVGSAGGWVASQRGFRVMRRIDSGRKTLGVGAMDGRYFVQLRPRTTLFGRWSKPTFEWHYRLGRPYGGVFYLWARGNSLDVHCSALAPPALFGAYPFLTLVMIPACRFLRRQRRREDGLCVDCGYDLTGNESGVCSECGTEIERP